MGLVPENKFEHEHLEEYADGECIFEEGDIGRDLFVVQQGGVRILKKIQSGQAIELVTFTRGDFFGDMALLQSVPRYASAYAVGKTKLLILKPGGFLLKIRRDPTFAFEMMQQLSLRVKLSNERLLQLVNQFSLPQDEVQKILNSLGKS